MSDDKLFNCFDERLQCREREMLCGNKNCICLDIFLSLNVREAVAKYLVWFERKNKYEQDSTIMEWYRYVSKAQQMGKSNWYQVLFYGSVIKDASIRKASSIINCARRECSK